VSPIRVLLLDNHDSFTWNLVHAFRVAGAAVDVVLADEVDARSGLDGYDALVISPGPGRPEDAGASVPMIRAAAGRLPILGVCLGHQAIALAFDGVILRAAELVHGKTSTIRHDGEGVFAGLPNPFEATRYHSLAVDTVSFPATLQASAVAPDGTIMGLRHRALPIHGVQFHPESILTPQGHILLENFLALAASRPAAAR